VLVILATTAIGAAETSAEFPFKPNDRVAWIGSSSTRIGTWCRTMEYLLRTRHPELKLAFAQHDGRRHLRDRRQKSSRVARQI